MIPLDMRGYWISNRKNPYIYTCTDFPQPVIEVTEKFSIFSQTIFAIRFYNALDAGLESRKDIQLSGAMKFSTTIIILLMGFSSTSCNPGSIQNQSPAYSTPLDKPLPTDLVSTTAEPYAIEMATTPPTHNTKQTLKHSLTSTHTPTQKSVLPTSAPTTEPTLAEDSSTKLLLPDLQTLQPSDLRLLYDADTGRALIRFTNSIWNSGPGNLELVGHRDQTQERILVSQRVYATDPEIYEEYDVGEFIFYDEHHHWHIARFARYEVWTVDELGSLEGVVSTREKVSWCVVDDSVVEIDLPEGNNAAGPNYFSCEGEIQGLSVGWLDIYEFYLPRQWVEIPSLQDGLYALVSTVNPDKHLIEADMDNNTGLIYFEVRDLRLNILGSKPFVQDDLLHPSSTPKP